MRLKKWMTIGVLGLSCFVLNACGGQETHKSTTSKQETTTQSSKYRTVITTDGEVDDMNSMIRYLYYSNEMDLAGIVITSSTYHYAGDKSKNIQPYRWTGTDWIYKMLDAYDKIQPNLKKHAKGYPTADSIRKITKVGNIKTEGDMTDETAGSKLLEKIFLDNDKRKLYVQTWGGTNTTARALKSIEEKYKDTSDWKKIQDKIYDKLVLYIILNQDATYDDYIAKSWPKLIVINDTSNFWHFAYAWQSHSDKLNTTLKADWQKKNILDGNGPLMDLYASMGDGKIIEGELPEEQRGSDDYLKNNPQYKQYDFISEGDSPSYFYLLQNGLNDAEHPEYGGWGGRFGKVSDHLSKNTVLDYDPYSKQFEASYTLTRWFDDIQNDFAARIEWGNTNNYKGANHAPTVTVKEGTKLSAKAGQTIKLTALAKDPDDDKMTYKWWRYFEADTYQEKKPSQKAESSIASGMQLDVIQKTDDGAILDPIKLEDSTTKTVSFKVPKDAKKGDTLHLIIEVQDNGKHHLKTYQRVIIRVD